MPGAYAHLTLAHRANSLEHLDGSGDFPQEALDALQSWSKFCELGAVSPDYPYMKLFDSDAAAWADAMHYEHTGPLILAGVQKLRAMEGNSRDKCFAWLLGYASHVIADVTIHPVVEAKVGPYDENKTAHRVCEMNQDVHIFSTLNLGEAGACDFIGRTLGRCGTDGLLDADVARFWRDLLAREHVSLYRENSPSPDEWHRRFSQVVENVADWSNLPDLIRRFTGDYGLTYPEAGAEDRQYLINLPSPEGDLLLSYDEVFSYAHKNVLEGWKLLSIAVYGGGDLDKSYADAAEFFQPWNLDTGRTLSGRRTFWA